MALQFKAGCPSLGQGLPCTQLCAKSFGGAKGEAPVFRGEVSLEDAMLRMLGKQRKENPTQTGLGKKKKKSNVLAYVTRFFVLRKQVK